MAEAAPQEQSGGTHRDKSTEARDSVEADLGRHPAKCAFCAKDKQKCVRDPGASRCQRCVQLSYPCGDNYQAETLPTRRKLNYMKCDLCRTDKKKCEPEDRVWPNRCDRCMELQLPCSPPSARGKYARSQHSSVGESVTSVSSVVPILQKNRNRHTQLAAAITPSRDAIVERHGVPVRGGQRERAYYESSSNISAGIRPSLSEEDASSPSQADSRIYPYLQGVGARWPNSTDSAQPLSGPGSLTVFQYPPLQGTIRLMKLLPATEQAPLECVLVERDLGTVEDYEALSYSWGDPEPSAVIHIRQGSRLYRLGITQNLAAALTQLRYPDRERLFWVDAVCINQQDPMEKNQQVSKMAEIYSNAAQVCAWLGNEDYDSRLALDFIKNSILDLGAFSRLNHEQGYVKEWQALSAFMNRPWFSRLWIIQEIGLATKANIYCGKESISWADFADATALIHELRSESNRRRNDSGFEAAFSVPDAIYAKNLPAVRFVDVVSNLLRRYKDGRVAERLQSLEFLVASLSQFNCADPRDHIYACLGLAKDVSSVPDMNVFMARDPWRHGAHVEKRASSYRPSEIVLAGNSHNRNRTEPLDLTETLPREKLSVIKKFVRIWRGRVAAREVPVNYVDSFFEVAKTFVSFCIRRSASLDIICRPWAPQYDTGFPSWIRTLNDAAFRYSTNSGYKRVNADPLVGHDSYFKQIYNAAGSTTAEMCKMHSGIGYCSLFIRGFVLDQISTKGDAAVEGTLPPDWMAFGGWEDNNEDPPENLWRVLVGNRDHLGRTPPRYYSRAFKVAAQSSISGAINTENMINLGHSDIVRNFLLRVQAVTWMRRLIKTSKDHLGLAPKKAKKRDLICIIYGCSVPLLLRPHPRYPGTYELIGECYIYGMMDGEALQMRSDDSKLQDFEIR